MITKGLDIVKDKLQTWFEYRGGLGVQLHWFNKGIDLWLKFTKGQKNAWSKQQSYYLPDIVCYTAFNVAKILERNVDLTNDQIYHVLSPFLSRAIKNFIEPDHMELFLDETFN